VQFYLFNSCSRSKQRTNPNQIIISFKRKQSSKIICTVRIWKKKKKLRNKWNGFFLAFGAAVGSDGCQTVSSTQLGPFVHWRAKSAHFPPSFTVYITHCLPTTTLLPTTLKKRKKTAQKSTLIASKSNNDDLWTQNWIDRVPLFLLYFVSMIFPPILRGWKRVGEGFFFFFPSRNHFERSVVNSLTGQLIDRFSLVSQQKFRRSKGTQVKNLKKTLEIWFLSYTKKNRKINKFSSTRFRLNLEL